ncbi:hypothetical protein D3C71_1089720 [compost metagenome]
MKILILSALSLAVLLVGCHSSPSKMTATTTTAMDTKSVHQTTEKQGLKLAVQAYTQDQSDYQTSLYDLNQDGIDDAVVLLSGMEWCGSGGCTLLIFQGLANGSFQQHSKMTVSSTPIYALSTQTKGWRDLSVYTRGLGQVVLKYNGKSYPSNPSLASKYTANLKQVGNTLLLPIAAE